MAAQFFQNELEIEELRRKIADKIEENKVLLDQYPYLRPMKGHLREKGQRETAENRDAESEREPEGPPTPKKRREAGFLKRRRKGRSSEI